MPKQKFTLVGRVAKKGKCIDLQGLWAETGRIEEELCQRICLDEEAKESFVDLAD